MDAQRQIDEDHRLALELSQFPESSGDIESNGYRQIAANNSPRGPSARESAVISADDYADYNVNDFSGLGRKGSYTTGSATADENRVIGGGGRTGGDDWSLARALQALEFEIAADIDTDEDYESLEEHDFRQKEIRASGCRRQLFTVSAFFCLVYIAVFIASTQIEGIAPSYENPMLGPPITVLVRFGAKEASLQAYRKEWWRLISAISLHGGVWHILPNVFIQLRVGGYLNLVFGTPMWLTIYFISGIFGNMCSTIFFQDKVGVGASGAIMGILSAWIVWIAFRWEKIPARFRSQRNCQMMVVVAAVVLTLATSFAPYVDWSVHIGGVIQGSLWGVILLGKELTDPRVRNFSRFAAAMISFGLIAYTAYYIVYYVRPSHDLLDYFEANDDWHNNDNINNNQ